MGVVRFKDVPGLDGEYELDASSLTNREFRTIKKLSGLRPREIEDAIVNADVELVVALAKVALERAGRGDVPADLLWDAEAGQIVIDFDAGEEPDEGDAGPPEIPPSPPASETSDGASD
jgi:hypothetical protein